MKVVAKCYHSTVILILQFSCFYQCSECLVLTEIFYFVSGIKCQTTNLTISINYKSPAPGQNLNQKPHPGQRKLCKSLGEPREGMGTAQIGTCISNVYNSVQLCKTSIIVPKLQLQQKSFLLL